MRSSPRSPRTHFLLLLMALGLASPAAAAVLVDDDFEAGLGAWSHPGGADFDWTRNQGATPSNGTGPSGDHTTGSGWYVYAEATAPNHPSKTALFEGPCVDLSARSAASWTFWYQMTGTDVGTLYAEAADSCAATPSTWTPITTFSGDQGSSWLEANVDLASRLGTSFKIRFRAVTGATGNGWSGDIAVDDVRVEATGGPPTGPPAQQMVDALDFALYKGHIATLASTTGPTGGSRHWSQPGNAAALDYIEAELVSYGYTVERHAYSFGGQTRENVYATKVGTLRPDEMYIISGHMDSINFDDSPSYDFAPGADDDASGTSVVLEAARVFGLPSVTTETSVRFILWNNEETGLDGSEAYVSDRRSLQGVESPMGSGLYPEPTWLGIAQHDMMLWDHGLPPGPNQIPGADVDIEYQASSSYSSQSLALANAFQQANVDYAPAYPAEVGNNMNHTDSKSFWSDCPAISLRENQRVTEIGQGSNPNWHADTDVYATYSEDDFMLGFTALQTTVGAIAELSGASVNGPIQPVPLGSPAAGLLLGVSMLASGRVVLRRRARSRS